LLVLNMNLNSRKVNPSDIWIFHSKVFSSEQLTKCTFSFYLKSKHWLDNLVEKVRQTTWLKKYIRQPGWKSTLDNLNEKLRQTTGWKSTSNNLDEKVRQTTWMKKYVRQPGWKSTSDNLDEKVRQTTWMKKYVRQPGWKSTNVPSPTCLCVCPLV